MTQALQSPFVSSGQLVVVTKASCSTKTWRSQHHDGCPHRSLHFWSQEKTNQSIWFALSLYCWTIHQPQHRFQLAESVIKLKLLFSKNFPNRFGRKRVWTYRKTFSSKHQIASIASYPPTAVWRHTENASGWVGFGVSLERLFDRESRCYFYSLLGLHQMASSEGVWRQT